MSQDIYKIVIGNEKGGTGKSTTAMHLATALLKLGFKVVTIDVDARQGTFTRYVDNRKAFSLKHNKNLPMPDHYAIKFDQDLAENHNHCKELDSIVHDNNDKDFIIIDTAGSNTPLSRHAHSYADTLITPLNDSFVDLDVIAHVSHDNQQMIKPSIYAEWVWEQKKQKAVREKKSMDWIVLRNRLSQIQAKNKSKMEQALTHLSKRLAFRLLPGFSERVVFRELFPYGLTLLDLQSLGKRLTLSHIAAKQELRSLLCFIEHPRLQEAIDREF